MQGIECRLLLEAMAMCVGGTMDELRFWLAGVEAATAVTALTEVLENASEARAITTPANFPHRTDRKGIDWRESASLVVSISSAALFNQNDLVGHFRVRKKAEAIVTTARRLRTKWKVETLLETPGTSGVSVADLDADTLLRLVMKADRR